MLRKHFNSMTMSELEMIPFYCWNCLSIQLSNREVDIVIKDTYQMNCFIKFLIRNLRTIDGKRGSANQILEVMNNESVEHYKKKNNRRRIEESVRLKIIQRNEHKVFHQTYLKYVIMRVRAKISFIALERRMTIVELIASTIQKCLLELIEKKLMPDL